ncbi:hypothetical protein [Xanthomonas campestris]|uniref:hypothetical protein n=1 Tax=Xanthomonas campestris TaxID=339 RepID=UPI002B233776|nr:hypothetical protein [Xanthomonas campestris]MEA9793407.1 hypothetical protein [Xanthomonas campestris pv. raphani]
MHWKLLIYLKVLCSTLVQLYAGDACTSDDSSSGVLKLRADIIAAAENPDQASESKRLAHVMQTYALAGIRLRLKQDAQKLSPPTHEPSLKRQMPLRFIQTMQVLPTTK